MTDVPQVAAGAANSAIAVHFARGRPGAAGGGAPPADIGEIYAKGGAVGTLSGLLGLGLSLALARATGSGAISWCSPFLYRTLQ